MKMLMLLLVSALALHATSALRNPHLNLNRIIELVEQYNVSSTTDFVEDLSDLTEGGNRCGDKFFCKVHDILKAHNPEWRITRNLNVFNNRPNVTCSEVTRGLNPSTTQVPIRTLLDQLKGCCQYRNFSGLTTTSP